MQHCIYTPKKNCSFDTFVWLIKWVQSVVSFVVKCDSSCPKREQPSIRWPSAVHLELSIVSWEKHHPCFVLYSKRFPQFANSIKYCMAKALFDQFRTHVDNFGLFWKIPRWRLWLPPNRKRSFATCKIIFMSLFFSFYPLFRKWK